jgi:hypothetical protein
MSAEGERWAGIEAHTRSKAVEQARGCVATKMGRDAMACHNHPKHDEMCLLRTRHCKKLSETAQIQNDAPSHEDGP